MSDDRKLPPQGGDGGLVMPSRWSEIAILSAMTAGALWYLEAARDLPVSRNPVEIGSGAFPLLVAGGMLTGLILLLAGGLFAGQAARARKITVARPACVLLAMVATGLGAMCLDRFGPVAATLLCSVLLLLAGGERRLVVLVLAPAGLAAGIHILFVMLLGVRFY